jgi:hypothetical protein
MAMVCPQCNSIHDQSLQCPTCKGRLVYYDLRGKVRRFPRPTGSWLQSFAGRLMIGLVLAQGLYLGLRHLITGTLLALWGDEALQEFLRTMPALIELEILQVTPLLIGAMLAAAGRRQAFVLGFTLGLVNSIASMAAQAFLTHQASALSWYGQPLLQAGCGCLGAWLGAVIWKPSAEDTLPVALGEEGRPRTALAQAQSMLAGSVAWFRVAVGSLLAVAGSCWAQFLLDTVLIASAGRLDTTSHLQDQIFTWEIRALAILFGAAFAGATTHNGLKQGLGVALITTLALLALPINHKSANVALLTVISTFLLGLTGGWFGSQLLPPLQLRSKNTSGPMG